MRADLHVHTTASDGSFPPKAVVEKAKEAGMAAIAITDHDTVEGVQEAVAAGLGAGIEVLPGIELGADYEGIEVHILGYCIDIENSELLEKLSWLRRARMERIERMVEKIRKMGIPVEMEEVLAIAGIGSVGRPHLAKAMVAAGAVKSTAEAFEKFIGAGRLAYVARQKLRPAEAIELVRGAGGLAVLAHPGLGGAGKLFYSLAGAGLGGVEVYHPSHSWEESLYYRMLAAGWDLVATGGSDYHGPGHKSGWQIGLKSVSYETVNEIKRRIG